MPELKTAARFNPSVAQSLAGVICGAIPTGKAQTEKFSALSAEISAKHDWVWACAHLWDNVKDLLLFISSCE